MEPVDFKKTHRAYYTATAKKIADLPAQTGRFLLVEGAGAPGGEAFGRAIEALYTVAYTAKFTLKFAGALDFKISALECLWHVEDPHHTPLDQWRWTLMIRVPDDLAPANVTDAKKTAAARRDTDLSAVKLKKMKEGRALQVLHVGPYDHLDQTYRRLGAFAEQNGLTAVGPGHEIYLSDPRRTAPERLKTIVRLPVKKA